MIQNQNENNFINHIKRLPCEPSESPSQIISDQQSECDGEGAIQQFKREIEERFKLSVANKLYSFPRRITSASDLISSDESSCGQDNNDNEETEPLKPISKTNRQNEVSQSHKRFLTQKQPSRPFKKKDDSCVRDTSNHRVYEDPQVAGFDNKMLKIKKRSGKQKSKQKKQDSLKGTKQKESHRSKRFNTEPDSHNYVDTLRAKNRR